MPQLQEHSPQTRARLRLESVGRTVVTRLSRQDEYGLTVQQPLPFLRLNASVRDDKSRVARIHSVSMAVHDGEPRLVIDLIYDRESLDNPSACADLAASEPPGSLQVAAPQPSRSREEGAAIEERNRIERDPTVPFGLERFESSPPRKSYQGQGYRECQQTVTFRVDASRQQPVAAPSAQPEDISALDATPILKGKTTLARAREALAAWFCLFLCALGPLLQRARKKLAAWPSGAAHALGPALLRARKKLAAWPSGAAHALGPALLRARGILAASAVITVSSLLLALIVTGVVIHTRIIAPAVSIASKLYARLKSTRS